MGRKQAGLTQLEAAARLGVSQPYLSLLERGQRKVTERVARAAARVFGLSPATLPVPPEFRGEAHTRERLPCYLAALSYPGYLHLRAGRPVNPAVVVLEALSDSELDARVAQALPWVLERYAELDWNWLVSQARLRNLQNKLGFLVSLAAELAGQRVDKAATESRLRQVEQELEKSRLVAETSLSREEMPPAERAWLRANRPHLAERWNVLTNLTVQQLPYA